MNKFSATVEFLLGQRAAIISLTDQTGDWAGAGRVEVRSGKRSDLYECAQYDLNGNALELLPDEDREGREYYLIVEREVQLNHERT